MRRRLIVAFVTLAVTIIGLYGVPRLFTLTDSVKSSEARYSARMADIIAVLITERGVTAPVDAAYLAPLISDGEGLRHVTADGDVVQVGVQPDGDDISATVGVPAGGTVTFTRSGEVVWSRLEAAIAPVVGIGVVLLVASVAVAVLLARRLSQPFVRLVETAKAMGRGGVAAEPEVLRIPEAAAIDRALRVSAETLERRIRREHEFAANASHQLRTPITAVRLELEDLSLWPETPPVVRDQLDHAIQEIDRLADAITQLLAMARGETADAAASEPLDAQLRGAAERWSPEAGAAGRRIQLTPTDDALGAVPAAASQILDVLLHNAIAHGRGTITLSAVRRTEYVTVQVADEGRRPGGNAIFQRRPEQRSATSGEGIGLALSSELAESLGGHLLLEGDERTTFSLILPVRA